MDVICERSWFYDRQFFEIAGMKITDATNIFLNRILFFKVFSDEKTTLMTAGHLPLTNHF